MCRRTFAAFGVLFLLGAACASPAPAKNPAASAPRRAGQRRCPAPGARPPPSRSPASPPRARQRRLPPRRPTARNVSDQAPPPSRYRRSIR